MITIQYDEQGTPVSDFYLDNFLAFLKELIEEGQETDHIVHISTSNAIYAVRLAVVRGEIKPSDILLLIDGAECTLDTYGGMSAIAGADIIQLMSREILLTGSQNWIASKSARDLTTAK